MTRELSGVVVVDKPSGPTSFDVVRRVKGLFKAKRCGHTGTLEVHGKVATITITNAMVAKTGSEDDLTDGFINYARSIDGVEVAASFREPLNGGPWHVSFRSRGRVNVAAIAQKFGGGGHHNAAGCSIDGEESAVRKQIASEVEEALKHDA